MHNQLFFCVNSKENIKISHESYSKENIKISHESYLNNIHDGRTFWCTETN